MASIDIPDGPFYSSCTWNIESNNSWLVQIGAWGGLIFEIDIPQEAVTGPGVALIEGQQAFARRLRKLLGGA